ncbi:hypothetical protein AYI68_g1686 [Smittium mucronatum]|uniref:WKF domain-containing protein n=1 Tax=Smittium mucronatum TaxID=133383 RepID=A0A1R0H4M1_9FUNG|nr:hypothetical protein AYI68_g1686 [Smittium mucronatum]
MSKTKKLAKESTSTLPEQDSNTVDTSKKNTPKKKDEGKSNNLKDSEKSSKKAKKASKEEVIHEASDKAEKSKKIESSETPKKKKSKSSDSLLKKDILEKSESEDVSKKSKKKSEKKQKLKQEPETLENEKEVTADLEDEPKKKVPKRNNDPRSKKQKIKDALAEKAEQTIANAINYILVWKNARESWKFSKPKQSWLIRNTYNSDLINDANFCILAEYISTIKGMQRDIIFNNAKKLISEKAAIEESIQSDSDKLIVLRATAIIDKINENQPSSE